MARQCHHCGQAWGASRQPGRQETCENCGADWRVCRNCAHHDQKVAHQCRERRAERVMEKDRANYCEWFELGAGAYRGESGNNPREDAARERLKKLFGD